jgi:hypothetical protein
VIAIDIDHIDSDCRRFRHGREGYPHLLT